MPCGSCGGKRRDVEYVVTFADGSPQRTFASHAEARIAAAQSAKGGKIDIKPKTQG